MGSTNPATPTPLSRGPHFSSPSPVKRQQWRYARLEATRARAQNRVASNPETPPQELVIHSLEEAAGRLVNMAREAEARRKELHEVLRKRGRGDSVENYKGLQRERWLTERRVRSLEEHRKATKSTLGSIKQGTAIETKTDRRELNLSRLAELSCTRVPLRHDRRRPGSPASYPRPGQLLHPFIIAMPYHRHGPSPPAPAAVAAPALSITVPPTSSPSAASSSSASSASTTPRTPPPVPTLLPAPAPRPGQAKVTLTSRAGKTTTAPPPELPPGGGTATIFPRPDKAKAAPIPRAGKTTTAPPPELSPGGGTATIFRAPSPARTRAQILADLDASHVALPAYARELLTAFDAPAPSGALTLPSRVRFTPQSKFSLDSVFTFQLVDEQDVPRSPGPSESETMTLGRRNGLWLPGRLRRRQRPSALAVLDPTQPQPAPRVVKGVRTRLASLFNIEGPDAPQHASEPPPVPVEEDPEPRLEASPSKRASVASTAVVKLRNRFSIIGRR